MGDFGNFSMGCKKGRGQRKREREREEEKRREKTRENEERKMFPSILSRPIVHRPSDDIGYQIDWIYDDKAPTPEYLLCTVKE